VDQGKLSIEQATTTDVTLARIDDPTRAELEGDGQDQAAVDPWAAARARLSETFKPSFGRSPFEPLEGSDGKPMKRYQNVPIGSGIHVERMILPHEPEPRESGQGAVYFFPTGMTEHAIIQLSDGRGRVYSVEIHPLTGQAKVHAEAFEPENVGERGFNEVEDPS